MHQSTLQAALCLLPFLPSVCIAQSGVALDKDCHADHQVVMLQTLSQARVAGQEDISKRSLISDRNPNCQCPGGKSSQCGCTDNVVLANVDRPLTVSFPIAWFHVPKCGSTFLNSLLTIPGACDFASANLTSDADFAGMLVAQKYFIDINAVCPGSFLDPPDLGIWGIQTGQTWDVWFHHSGVNSIYQPKVQGHGFTILRQPEQRIISAWNYHQHSWPFYYYERWANTMMEFAQAVSGCAVKMMTRDGIAIAGSNVDPHAPCGDPVPSTDAETRLAVKRLRDGFVFVGIVEEWDMSICLLHKMFGSGPCHAVEFGNARPGTKSTSFYNTSDLNGFVDVHDGILYAEAVQIYRSLLQKFDVSASTCEPCFEESAEVASVTTMEHLETWGTSAISST